MPRLKSLLLNIFVLVIGIVLLVVSVQRAGGWSAVASGVTSVGWWFGVVVALGAARMVCRAAAWQVCADDGRLPLHSALAAVLAGDVAGNLTPLGLFASEPTKVLMTRARLSTVVSVASVTIENAFYTSSVLLVLVVGTALLLQRADVPLALQQISKVIIGLIAIAVAVGLWLARQRPAMLSGAAPFVTRLVGRSAVPTDAVREVEARIYGVLRWPVVRLVHVYAWEVCFHVLAIAEVWVVLRLLARVTFADVFVMEAVGRFVTVAFKFVPYRVGIDEAGSGAVSQVIGLSSAIGVSLALVRRLRILVLNAIGVAILATIDTTHKADSATTN